MPDINLKVIIDAENRIGSAVSQAQSQMEKLKNSIAPAADASRKFAIGLAAVGAAAVGFGSAAVMAANNMEQMEISFTTMLGSAENAKSFMVDLINFAKKTPFELKGLQTASAQLMAYGFTQKEILPNLKALGDIASGVGMEKLPNLILAYGQVRAATRLTGMELRQFTEAGVPMLEELSKVMKKPVSEIQKLVSAGEVGFKDVQTALMNLTGEGGRFNNLMSNQMETVGGKISNLKDTWNIFLAVLGKEFLPMVKKIIDALIPFVQDTLPQWIAKVKEITEWFVKHKEVLIIVAGVIVGALIPAIASLIITLGAGVIALAPYMIAGAAVGAVILGLIWLAKNLDILKESTAMTLSKLIEAFYISWEKIKEIIGNAVDWITKKLDPLTNAEAKLIETLYKAQSGIGSAGRAIGGAASKVGGILGFQDGGIVPGAQGSPLLAMVHGGERILTASESQKVGQTLIFNFNGAVAGDDGIMKIINQAIEKLNNLNNLKLVTP